MITEEAMEAEIKGCQGNNFNSGRTINDLKSQNVPFYYIHLPFGGITCVSDGLSVGEEGGQRFMAIATRMISG